MLGIDSIVEVAMKEGRKPTYKEVTHFAINHGNVKVHDEDGGEKVVEDGPDDVELVEKAKKFWFDGTWYSRADFNALIRSSTLG
jgi:hypothetical protein